MSAANWVAEQCETMTMFSHRPAAQHIHAVSLLGYACDFVVPLSNDMLYACGIDAPVALFNFAVQKHLSQSSDDRGSLLYNEQ